jgi:hypothetical protein
MCQTCQKACDGVFFPCFLPLVELEIVVDANLEFGHTLDHLVVAHAGGKFVSKMMVCCCFSKVRRELAAILFASWYG